MDTQNTDITDIETHLKEDMLLRFRVGPFRFCVPAIEVEGIIVPPDLTVIPLNPPHSKGVFLHHGQIASAISLRSKFGLSDHEDNNLGQLILGIVSAGLVGFWVDEVYETVDSTELEWRAMPDFVPHEAFESFATKGDSVVMASTMQKLYDVPAEQASSMLAGVRESYDLPEDIPPVAAESFDAAGSVDDEDAFGDLASEDAGASVEVNRSYESDMDSTARDSLLDKGAGEASSASITDIPAESSSPGSGAESSVIDLESRRQKQSEVSLQNRNPGSEPGADSSHQTNKSANTAKDRSGDATRTYSTARGVNDRNRANAIQGRGTSRAGTKAGTRVGGGTYAGSVERMHQQQAYAQPSSYWRPGEADSQRQSHNQVENYANHSKRSSGSWWLLVLALLFLLLLAYWLWPSKKRVETISTFPTQNYRQPYSYQEPAVPDTAPPVSTEPDPAPTQALAEPEPPVENAGIEPPAETSQPNTVDKEPSEVYRLEGEDVTLTVERNAANTSNRETGTPDTPAPAVTGNVTPGYREFVHIVVKGDTLWDIAAKYLKNPFRYPELAELSRIDNPDLIYPGDTVRIRARNK